MPEAAPFVVAPFFTVYVEADDGVFLRGGGEGGVGRRRRPSSASHSLPFVSSAPVGPLVLAAPRSLLPLPPPLKGP